MNQRRPLHFLRRSPWAWAPSFNLHTLIVFGFPLLSLTLLWITTEGVFSNIALAAMGLMVGMLVLKFILDVQIYRQTVKELPLGSYELAFTVYVRSREASRNHRARLLLLLGALPPFKVAYVRDNLRDHNDSKK